MSLKKVRSEFDGLFPNERELLKKHDVKIVYPERANSDIYPVTCIVTKTGLVIEFATYSDGKKLQINIKEK